MPNNSITAAIFKDIWTFVQLVGDKNLTRYIGNIIGDQTNVKLILIWRNQGENFDRDIAPWLEMYPDHNGVYPNPNYIWYAADDIMVTMASMMFDLTIVE